MGWKLRITSWGFVLGFEFGFPSSLLNYYFWNIGFSLYYFHMGHSVSILGLLLPFEMDLRLCVQLPFLIPSFCFTGQLDFSHANWMISCVFCNSPDLTICTRGVSYTGGPQGAVVVQIRWTSTCSNTPAAALSGAATRQPTFNPSRSRARVVWIYQYLHQHTCCASIYVYRACCGCQTRRLCSASCESGSWL